MTRALLVFLALACGFSTARAQTSWQQAFAAMPLSENVSELDRHNCVRVMLSSFHGNDTVQALIFMPGATDEFYFFRRARATLTNATPTLLDAVAALTNQTYIRATFSPPFLLLHTAQDPLEPAIVIENERTVERMKGKHFEKHGLFNDMQWDKLGPILGFDFNTHITPRAGSHDSWHFFRGSFAEDGLNGWDALRAVALASKTKFTVKKNWIAFAGDNRVMAKPAPVDGFLLRDEGVIK
ncbi:MAG TPA: hypothetical protein VGO59_20845 [Verrucomicrobiae bacterium]|jgi:hypothetical protein